MGESNGSGKTSSEAIVTDRASNEGSLHEPGDGGGAGEK